MKQIVSALALMTACTASFGTPSWMWIGTYAIDDYGGSPYSTLNWQIGAAEAFWDGADAYCSIAMHFLDRTDAQVTFSQVTNNSDRELCDFVFYGGHGSQINPVICHTDDLTGWTSTTPPQLSFGTDYLRWVYGTACKLLHDTPSFWSKWSQAFQGVQCVLGYESLGITGYWSGPQIEAFWEYWSGGTHTMWEAYCESMDTYAYDQGHYESCIAAITSAPPCSGLCEPPYSHRTYAEAVSESGNSPTLINYSYYGTPNY